MPARRDSAYERSLSLPTTCFLLESLPLQPTMSNLLRDVRHPLLLADASRWCPLARGLTARDSRLTAPASRAGTIAGASAPVDVCRPATLDLVVPSLVSLADGAHHRQTRHRHRLASTRVPSLLDVEEPPSDGSADRPPRGTHADSHDVG